MVDNPEKTLTIQSTRAAADQLASIGAGLIAQGNHEAARAAFRAAAEIDLADDELQKSWGGPFNGQAKRCALFLDLLKLTQPAAILETGTYRGTTTQYMAEHFHGPIYTCEIEPRFFLQSQMKLSSNDCVTVVESDLRAFLEDVLISKVGDGPVFFYLDAHWSEDLPLRQELEIILKQGKPSVVMIDDFRVPFDDGYRYDDYGEGKILDLGLIEFLREASVEIFFPSTPSWEETGARRGCVVIMTAGIAATVGHSTLLKAGDWRDWKLAECQTELAQTKSDNAILRVYIEELKRLNEAITETKLQEQVTPNVDRDTSEWPLISIVVPSYNQGPYIAETIHSILDQDYPNIEVIVMDGESTDETVTVLRSFPQITWFSERDLGQSHAINKGMLLARGSIRAYLNSDDVYRPGALRKVAQIFKDEPDTKIVVGNCDLIDQHSSVIGHINAKFTDLRGLVEYWGWEKLHCIPQQATFWRASLMSEVGLFNTDLRVVMDYEYWLRTATRTKFRTVDQTLAGSRLMAGTKKVSRTNEMYDEEYATFLRYRHVLRPKKRLICSLKARKHYAHKLMIFAKQLIMSEHQRKKPKKLLKRVAQIWPPYFFSPTYQLCVRRLLQR